MYADKFYTLFIRYAPFHRLNYMIVWRIFVQANRTYAAKRCYQQFFRDLIFFFYYYFLSRKYLYFIHCVSLIHSFSMPFFRSNISSFFAHFVFVPHFVEIFYYLLIRMFIVQINNSSVKKTDEECGMEEIDGENIAKCE